jgi:maltose/moltooligosaccharide transporter
VKNKPDLSFWQIWNMSFGFLGIQYGFGLQQANMSPIYRYLGADESSIPGLWLAGPLTGLFLQPIIGTLSDRSWSNTWGRRKPYIFIGAIVGSLAMILMPNSKSVFMAACLMWLLDAGLNSSMEPFRAFVGDLLNNKQRPTGFAVQSFMVGFGQTLANLMPTILAWILPIIGIAIAVTNNATKGIPAAVHLPFYIGAAAILLTVFFTMTTTKEYPPENEDYKIKPTFNEVQKKNINFWHLAITIVGAIMGGLFAVRIKYNEVYQNVLKVAQQQDEAIKTIKMTAEQQSEAITSGLYFGLICSGIILVVLYLILKLLVFKEILASLSEMPEVMRQLWWVKFFTWFGLPLMWQYLSLAIARYAFNAPDPELNKFGFEQGQKWGNLCFAIFSVTCFLISIFLPWIAKKIGSRRSTHALFLTIGALGFFSVLLSNDKFIYLFGMTLIGFAWGSIMSLPYLMIASAVSQSRMGVYMGIMNAFICVPQLVGMLAIPFVYEKLLGNDPRNALVLAGICMVCAAASCFLVKEVKSADEAAVV